MAEIIENTIRKYENAIKRLDQSYPEQDDVSTAYQCFREFHALLPEDAKQSQDYTQIEEDFKGLRPGDIVGRITGYKDKVRKIRANSGTLIGNVRKRYIPTIQQYENRIGKLENQIRDMSKQHKQEIDGWEEKLREITGMGVFREKDLLIEVYGVAFDIFKRKEPLARFLPPLEKCGEHIRSAGNPKNYGTNLIGIHSILSGKQVSGNMNIDKLAEYDPNSVPGLINELDKLFEDIINHYQTELFQS